MVHISLPEEKTRSLSFYLAMEEYIARNISENNCFFYWQVEPSVIFGRNQLIENEVNIEYCKKHNIKIFRRKSGGGCVYADMNNLMFSYITGDDNAGFIFNRYINMMIHILRKLGVEAKTSGRNDIMIGDRKVSGNAFYRIPKKSIVHGTMLYDTNMQNMVGSITPSDKKLISKGINSVRQRITLLKEYINLDIDQFKRFVCSNLCDREMTLTEKDIDEIKKIEKEYLSHEFIYGNNPRYTVIKKGRIENTGEFEIRMEIRNGIIKKINILGDFFIIGDINQNITDKLKNIPLEKSEISAVLPDRLDNIIMNLKKEDLVNLIINQNN